MIRQLTSVDAQFLAIEDGRTHGHVTALGIYDPSSAPGGALTYDAIRSLVASRLHLLEPFHWRLVDVPFGLGHPYWYHDPNLDLEFHVRELALPAPGDQRMLAEQVARIVARPLDRARPLWELYLIHGLQHGRVAVLTKVHHSAVDGMSGAEVLGALLDPTPGGRDVPNSTVALPDNRRKQMPGQFEMLARGLVGLPGQQLRALRGLPRALPHLDQVPTLRAVPSVSTVAALSRRAARVRRRARTTDGGILASQRVRAPRTSVNGTIGAHRRVALTSQPLAEVKRVKDHFGFTVNDVVVATCAGALRHWFQERGELPDDPLLAMIPLSVRTEAQRGTYGNRIGTMLTPIPTNIADPTERLAAAHETMRAAKERHRAIPATMLQDAADFIPPALFVRASRVTTAVSARLSGQAPINVVISNVPGSPVPLYLAGAELKAMYPVSAIAHGTGLNITVMSHAGSLNYGIVVDRDAVDDAWPLATAIDRAHADLLALAG